MFVVMMELIQQWNINFQSKWKESATKNTIHRSRVLPLFKFLQAIVALLLLHTLTVNNNLWNHNNVIEVVSFQFIPDSFIDSITCVFVIGRPLVVIMVPVRSAYIKHEFCFVCNWHDWNWKSLNRTYLVLFQYFVYIESSGRSYVLEYAK